MTFGSSLYVANDVPAISKCDELCICPLYIYICNTYVHVRTL